MAILVGLGLRWLDAAILLATMTEVPCAAGRVRVFSCGSDDQGLRLVNLSVLGCVCLSRIGGWSWMWCLVTVSCAALTLLIARMDSSPSATPIPG